MMRRLAPTLALMATALAPPAAAKCRQALALGLDVSGSVDAREYDLQLNGLAGALLSPEVQQAMLAYPDSPVALYVYEWSGLASQSEIIPWTEIATPADLTAIVDTLRAPSMRPRQAETAVGVALLFGAEALDQRRDCWRQTLDISADGKSNIGPRPRDLANHPLLRDITINALVVGVSAPLMAGTRSDSIPELSAYYRAEVIRGPDAFIQVALGYDDYRVSMEKKLLKELQTLPIGTLPGPPGTRRQAAVSRYSESDRSSTVPSVSTRY